ncbi:MAG: hypothetical protein ABEL51_03860 [Salinibacter sp.]
MRGVASPLRSSPITLVLGLLLAAGVGTIQTASAQQPSFTLDQPAQSFKQAAVSAESDSQLVGLATALMKARADTKISYSTYQKGVRVLKNTHPGFYGNFFGDPFYATYDSDYFNMVRYRRIAGRKVNPFSGLSGMFSCNPLGYDPAFNGRCRGFEFALRDFFLLPTGFTSAIASTWTSLYPRSSFFWSRFSAFSCRDGRGIADWCGSPYAEQFPRDEGHRGVDVPDRPDERSPRPDTVGRRARGPSVVAEAPRGDAQDPSSSRTPTASIDIDEDLSPTRVKPIRTPDRLNPRIEVPEDVSETIQTRVASRQRIERRMRIRKRIREEYGPPRTLTPEERSRIASQLADRRFVSDRQGGPRTRGHLEEEDTRRRPRTETPRSERPQPRSTPETRRPNAGNSNSRNGSATDRSEPQRHKQTQDESEQSGD